MPDVVHAELVIDLKKGKSREYVYTNKAAAHFSGETSARPTRSYHGMCVSMHKLLEDWRFHLDGRELTPDEAARTLALPHQLIRFFTNPRVREQICLIDGRDVLVVELVGQVKGEGDLWPLVDVRSVRQAIKPDYRITWRPEDNLLLIRGVQTKKAISAGPSWLGVTANVPLQFFPQERYLPAIYLRGQRRGVMGQGTPFQPGRLRFRLRRGGARFLFVAGRSQKEVKASAKTVLGTGTELIRRKKRRLGKLISRCPLKTGDSRLNNSLAWARASLDALIMNQAGPGIYAGLPWFANYWGRDTGIALPGATWVSGQFSMARKILHSLARQQDQRIRSRTYGRIPNLLEPGTRLYNTADGTLWFIRQLEEYLRYSGDVRTAWALFPTVKRAILGELSHRSDEHGLVVHGAAETWMDAGGEDHPRSPRGNRAVEIQVLWHTALLSGSAIAHLAGQPSLSAQWANLSKRVKVSFLNEFWDPLGQRLYDHLNADGSFDGQIRPNQLLALTVPFCPLLSRDQERAILDLMIHHLVYPHGVSTLTADDPQFRPRHLSEGRYHFDEAYHNGDVWLWLTGPLVTALIRHGCKELAHALTETLTNRILDKGAVGTLGELLNAAPTEENDNEAGTFTQAWSLAEYIRVVFQDYLGVRPNVLQDEVVIEPAVPVSWGDVNFQFAVFRGVVEAHYTYFGPFSSYTFLPKGLHKPLRLHLRIRLPGGKLLTVIRPLRSGLREEIRIEPHSRGWRVLVEGQVVNFQMQCTDFDVSGEKWSAFRKPPSIVRGN